MNLQASVTSRDAEDLLFFHMLRFVLEMFTGFEDVSRCCKGLVLAMRLRNILSLSDGAMVSQIVWLGVKDVFTQIAKDVVGQGLGHDLRTQMPRHAVRRVLQTTIKAATSPRNLPPDWGCIPNNPTRRQRLVVRQGPGTTGLSASLVPLSRELGPGPSLRTLLQTTIRTPKTSDFQAGLFPSFWTGTSDYITRIEFTTACQDAPGVISLDFGHSSVVTHGRSASVPYPREDGGTTICDTHADVPSARRLRAQLAFKDSMVHGILQFTPSIAFCYVLHRCESQDIHCQESGLVISGSYAYDSTKTEVLGMDERITTESAGTVRNRPTESDVSSFSGRSVSRLFVFHKSKNFTSDYEIRMLQTVPDNHYSDPEGQHNRIEIL
ncbi:hypothetical protein YC2023_071928 [Brassica napus]